MSKNGFVVDGEGWFVVNAGESRWKDEGPLGRYCNFEGKRRFPQLGINVSVLKPGEAMGAVPPRERAGGVSRGCRRVPADRRGAGAPAKVRANLPRSTWVEYRPGWLPGD